MENFKDLIREVESIKDNVVSLKQAVQLMDMKQRQDNMDIKEFLKKIEENTRPQQVEMLIGGATNSSREVKLG